MRTSSIYSGRALREAPGVLAATWFGALCLLALAGAAAGGVLRWT